METPQLTIHWQVNLTSDQHTLLMRLLAPVEDSPKASEIREKLIAAEIVYL